MHVVSDAEEMALTEAAFVWFGERESKTVDRVEVMASGASGAALRRITCGNRSFVLKASTAVEHDVLAWLADTRVVPRMVRVPGSPPASPVLVLEDLGPIQRPTSLDDVPVALRQAEATALATIHRRGVPPGLTLPAVDAAYLRWAIDEQFFRPAWTRALALGDFRDRFGASVETVERAVGTIVAEMTDLSREPRLRTLVHTDLNPSNVLLHGGQPCVIDWGTARTGPALIDVAHHFETRARAEIYRLALAAGGLELPAAAFDAWYAVAARYTGLRYIWWTLDWFASDPDAATPWVAHYLSLIAR